MKLFYFVGGPTEGHEDDFRRRLTEIGGSPSGWMVYPHRVDREALHLVRTADLADIDAHLAQFGIAYERGPIVELVDAPRR